LGAGGVKGRRGRSPGRQNTGKLIPAVEFCVEPVVAAWTASVGCRDQIGDEGMTYLRELIDRLGKALGFTSRAPRAAPDRAAAPGGLVDEGAPESES
jgi:hypothetical protein